MIPITKEEAEAIRKKFPKAEIVRTCVQKSARHKYYLAERTFYLRVIRRTNAEAAKLLDERKNSKQREFFY